MRRVMKIVLIILLIIAIPYGIYFLLGRPAIGLPTYRTAVSQGSQLYSIVKATETDEITLVVNTNGEIKARDGTAELLNIRYTPYSFNSLFHLASKYILPVDTQNTLTKIYNFFPPSRTVPGLVAAFFYYVVHLRVTTVIAAN